jgi:hypothetical protein
MIGRKNPKICVRKLKKKKKKKIIFQSRHCTLVLVLQFFFTFFFFGVRHADEWQSTCSTSIERKEMDGVNFTSPSFSKVWFLFRSLGSFGIFGKGHWRIKPLHM